MAKTIVQKVVFKHTTARELYDFYMNAKKHAKLTGAPAEITAKEGTSFSAHDGYITGENLKLIKDQLIVQSWRGSDWGKKDDSVFTIFLEPKGNNVTLHAIHANLPDKHADSINDGWHTYYWEPWQKHISAARAKEKAGAKEKTGENIGD